MNINNKLNILDTEEKVFNELGIKSVTELSNEHVFQRLINLDMKVDKEVLKMILPNIKNFSGLITTQQEFIVDLAKNQSITDQKAIDGFNKTKEIISEIITSQPNMDPDTMIYVVDSIKEMDRYISRHTKDSGDRMERLIKFGLMIGGAVSTAIIGIILNGNNDINKS